MRQFTTGHLTEMLKEQEGPCVSLYQPTHRHHPDNQQDPVRFRNLLKELEASLLQKFPAEQARDILQKFEPLAGDTEFWKHRTDALAILASSSTFHVFDLQRPVKELLVVAGSFHLKPLLRITQSADRYQILCIGRHEARLLEGNRDALDPVELTEVPSTIAEALGEELTDSHQTVASYGGTGGGSNMGRHGEPAMHHGHGGKKDEVDIDMERFFRVVDRGILEHHSRPSGLPLMLAALTEYHTPFRQISHNPHLMEEGIMSNPDAMSLEKMRTEAWQKVEPVYLKRLALLVDEYHEASSRLLGSDELRDIAVAAAEGRIATLLIEADRQMPGRIDPATGGIERGELPDPDTDDMLDDLAEITLRMKGDVVIVPADRMPSSNGMAAIYRF